MMTKKITSRKRTLMQRGKKSTLQLLAACGFLMGAGMMQSCEKDILTGQPEWLGNSIYERLQEGFSTSDGQMLTFNTTLRLIDELGYTDILSKTGSKTLFATPDIYFNQWLASNGKSLEMLSLNEKKQILKSSMINNAYLVDLMSNVTGNPPQPGMCLRRETETTIYDDVPKMTIAEMPVNPFLDVPNPLDPTAKIRDPWSKVREEGKDIYIVKDGTPAPMMHFLPEFMQNNNFTSEDLIAISNGSSSSTTDSWISGKKVISSEQTCKNGYIYAVDGVIESSLNMAQELHRQPNTTLWAKALDRFSCPDEITNGTMVKTFQGLYNTDAKLYQLRYFNSSTNHKFTKGGALDEDLNANSLLRIDPGWNQYSIATPGQDFHYDGAVMIVPTDEAIMKWWETGGGKDLKTRFGTWDNLGIENLASLINVNMLESLIGSIPTKFGSVLDNTSQRPLGIDMSHVKKCIMCCNGIIYLVDEVYAPDEDNTVISAAKLQTAGSYSTIHHAMTGAYDATTSSMYDFRPYLTAIDSRLGLIIPFNTTVSENTTIQKTGAKVFRIFDPCTFGLTKMKVLEFYYANDKVQGRAFDCTEGPAGYTVDYTSGTALTSDVIKNRLYDLIDNNIIVEEIVPGKEYFKTKAGGYIRAYKSGADQYLQGGLQLETGEVIFVPDTCIVDKLKDGGNGITYGVACKDIMEKPDPITGKLPISGVPQTASKSVYQILGAAAKSSAGKCNIFYQLLSGSDLMTNSEQKGKYECGGTDNFNIGIFDSYNYTVYVPTDESIQKLIDSGYLPTWDDAEALKEDVERGDEQAIKQTEVIKERIENFLRYHIQDNAVPINAGNINSTYETGMLNPANRRFFTLDVVAGKTSLTVTDVMKNKRNLVTTTGLYNKMAREYWIENKDKTAATIASSSHAVVHQIDGVLLYSAEQLTPWKITTSPAKAIRRK